jgi:hypothetical protein
MEYALKQLQNGNTGKAASTLTGSPMLTHPNLPPDIGASIRALYPQDAPAPLSPEARAAVDAESDEPPWGTDPTHANSTIDYLLTRKNGLGKDPNGLSWEIIKQAVDLAPRGREHLCSFIASIINAQDLTDDDILELRRIRGIPLAKANNGIRPIGLGSKWAQLCEGAVYRHAAPTVRSLLHPGALGYGVSAGIEAAVHGIRAITAATTNPDFVCIGLDIKNAFNSINRLHLLHAASRVSPHAHRLGRTLLSPDGKLLPIASFFTGTPSQIDVEVQTGCPQGAVSSSPLFNIAYSAILKPVLERHPLVRLVSIHDDTYVLGTAPACGAFIDSLAAALTTTGSGLCLAPNKFTVYAPRATPDTEPDAAAGGGNPSAAADPRSLTSLRSRINASCTTLSTAAYELTNQGITVAGAGVGTAAYESGVVDTTVNDTTELLSKIKALTVHEAWTANHRPENRRLNTFDICRILRECIAPRVTHLERTVPPRNAADPVAKLARTLAIFAINVLAGVDSTTMQPGDISLSTSLALLPSRLGGIGLGSLTPDASAMKYYASLNSSSHLVSATAGTLPSDSPQHDELAAKAAALLIAAPPTTRIEDKEAPPPVLSQRNLVRAANAPLATAIADSLKGPSKAFFLGLGSKAAAAIFRGHSNTLRDRQPRVHSRIAALSFFQLRLFIPRGLPDGARCPLPRCNGHLDKFGHHGMSCGGHTPAGVPFAPLGATSRTNRHDDTVTALTEAINRALTHVRVRSEGSTQELRADDYLLHRPPPAPDSKSHPDAIVFLDSQPEPHFGIPQPSARDKISTKQHFYVNPRLYDLARQAPPAGSIAPAPLPGSHPVLLDVAVYQETDNGDPAGGASTAFTAKMNHYVSRYFGINPLTFMPIAISYSGFMDPRSMQFLRSISSKGATKRQASQRLNAILGPVAHAVQYGNGLAIESFLYKHRAAMRAQPVPAAPPAAPAAPPQGAAAAAQPAPAAQQPAPATDAADAAPAPA